MKNDVVLSNGAAFDLTAILFRAIDELESFGTPQGPTFGVVEDLRTWTLLLLDAAYGVEGGRIDDEIW